MTYIDPAIRRQANADIARLQDVAKRSGYCMEYHPIVKVRGWPAPSAKPFALRTWGSSGIDGAHVASFATFDAMERSFRARAGL